MMARSRLPICMRSTRVLIGEATRSPYAKRSIAALPESLPNSTLVVLDDQEHNAMEAGTDRLVNAIITFAASR